MRTIGWMCLIAGWMTLSTGCGVQVMNAPPPPAAKGGAAPDVLKQFTPTPQASPGPAQAAPKVDNRVSGQQKEQPKGLAQSIRAASLRPERQNEMRTIGQFIKTFELDRNSAPKSSKEFADYIRREAPGIAKALDENYYILNTKMNIRDGNSVVCFEDALDGGLYLHVRVDGSVGMISPQDLKKALGN